MKSVIKIFYVILCLVLFVAIAFSSTLIYHYNNKFIFAFIVIFLALPAMSKFYRKIFSSKTSNQKANYIEFAVSILITGTLYYAHVSQVSKVYESLKLKLNLKFRKVTEEEKGLKNQSAGRFAQAFLKNNYAYTLVTVGLFSREQAEFSRFVLFESV